MPHLLKEMASKWRRQSVCLVLTIEVYAFIIKTNNFKTNLLSPPQVYLVHVYLKDVSTAFFPLISSFQGDTIYQQLSYLIQTSKLNYLINSWLIQIWADGV